MRSFCVFVLFFLLAIPLLSYAQDIEVNYEITDLGIKVTWELPEEIAGTVSQIRISYGLANTRQRPAILNLPGSARNCILKTELGEGQNLSIQLLVVYRDGGMKFARGAVTANGPTWDIDSVASAVVADIGPLSCKLTEIEVKGEAAEYVRVYDSINSLLLAEVEAGATEFVLKGLEQGCRYALVLVPKGFNGQKELRGKRTYIESFVTPLEKGWKLVNGGGRLNGDSPLPSKSYLLRPVFAFPAEAGGLNYTFPTADLGWCMGKYNTKKRRWEVRAPAGWTASRSEPCRPIYDGQFSFHKMEFFNDRSGGLHAIADCSTASNFRALDVHGNLHDMTLEDDEWIQWMGGNGYGRKRSRPLFSSWGGTGIGWSFAMGNKGVGLLVHSHYTYGSNKHVIANRLDVNNEQSPWQFWSEKGWAEHNKYGHTFIVGDKKDKLDSTNTKTVYLGRGKWLVMFRHGKYRDKEIWTALRYDDKKAAWERATKDGWAQEGDFVPVLGEGFSARTATLIADSKGKVWFYGIKGDKLYKAAFDDRKLTFSEPHPLGVISAGGGAYNQPFTVCLASSGSIIETYSRTGYNIIVGGKVIYTSPLPIHVLGISLLRKKPIVFFESEGSLFALREVKVSGELAVKDADYFSVAKAPVNGDYLEIADQWTNYATLSDNKTGPPYGPGESGRLAATLDGMLVSPHFRVCSVTLFPPGTTGDDGVYWGGFWDFFRFPIAAAVDSKRGKVYVSHRVTSGGGGGILGGRISVWDISEARRCVVRKAGLRKPSIKEEYKPGSLPGTVYWAADIAVDEEKGLVYVCESLENRIIVFDIKGETPKRLRYLGSEILKYPRAVDIGPEGRVFVLDTLNHRIVVFDSEGKVLNKWGSCGRGQGSLFYAWDIAVDPSTGFVFITDPINGRLQAFTSEGQFVFSRASFKPKMQQRGPRMQDIPSKMADATGLACDGHGNLYIGVGRTITKFKINPK